MKIKLNNHQYNVQIYIINFMVKIITNETRETTSLNYENTII